MFVLVNGYIKSLRDAKLRGCL